MQRHIAGDVQTMTQLVDENDGEVQAGR